MSIFILVIFIGHQVSTIPGFRYREYCEQARVSIEAVGAEQDWLVLEFEGLDLVHRFLNAFFEDFVERESVGAHAGPPEKCKWCVKR